MCGRTSIAVLLLLTASSPALPQTPGQRPKPALQAQPGFSAIQYIPEDVVAIAAVQPSRVIQAKHVQFLVEAASGGAELDTAFASAKAKTGFDPRDLLELVVLADQETLNLLTGQTEEAHAELSVLNHLKQVGLAMHNMHDVWGSFPDDDGLDDDNKGNLSWRVHALPYLEQAPLYNRFHLDEPWDSDHNKSLIKEMPQVFETSGVTEVGKTSFHVFTGEGAPFESNRGPGLRDIVDGTSNTLLCVLAGADKAEVWTKPGGLDFDPADPIKALGAIDGKFSAVFMDGAARTLPADLPAEEFARLIMHADGQVVAATSYETGIGRGKLMPGFVIHSSAPIDKAAVISTTMQGLGEGTRQSLGTLEVTSIDSSMVAFPNPTTVLIAPEPLLKKMIAKRAGTGPVLEQFQSRYPSSDLAVAVDLEPLQKLLTEVSQSFPMAGVTQKIRGVSFAIDLAGTGKSLLEAEIRTSTTASAQQISALVQGTLQMQKAQVLGMSNAENSPFTPETAERLTQILDAVNVSAKGTTTSLNIPKPDNMNQFVESLNPSVVQFMASIRQAREGTRRLQPINNLKMVGLACHNFHDVFNHFPHAFGKREGTKEGEGLSWRVHILPFVESAALYNEFQMDEPWDSEHNKALIERMPEIFKVEGVDKVGHTSMHVFTGEGTPLGSEDPIGIANIVDGTSNTFMAVVAGPDTAEIWTKPGGLEFDPDDPRTVLGMLAEKFLVLFCDGSVRSIDSTIDDVTLRNLIQMNDGNPIGDF